MTYTIQNIKLDNLILTYNVANDMFILLDKDKIIINDQIINKFIIELISENTYNLVMKYKNKIIKKKIILIFSSDKLVNPLFFNIYIKNNNTYDILKTKCDDLFCKSHYILKENIKSTLFKNSGKYIFHLHYYKLSPCKINVNNIPYNVLGYTKTASLKSTNFCNINRNLKNSWKVKQNEKCKYINPNNTSILKECSIDNKFETLLSEIPNISEIFKQYVKKTHLISAGTEEIKTNKALSNIDNKIGDEETREKTYRLNKTLSPEYKNILQKSIQDFDNLNEKQYTKKNYKTLLENIYEKNKEYQLLAKYKKCSGNKLASICKVNNIVSCQNKCNEIYDCAHISYDRKNKVCKLFNTCSKLKEDFNSNTYSKKSLLRNNGYNISNAILLHKNPPIAKLPNSIRLITFIVGIIIIFCSSILLFKVIKAFIKFFLCLYYDSCYSPLELLNPFTSGPDKKYI